MTVILVNRLKEIGFPQLDGHIEMPRFSKLQTAEEIRISPPPKRWILGRVIY